MNYQRSPQTMVFTFFGSRRRIIHKRQSKFCFLITKQSSTTTNFQYCICYY